MLLIFKRKIRSIRDSNLGPRGLKSALMQAQTLRHRVEAGISGFVSNCVEENAEINTPKFGQNGEKVDSTVV